VANDSYDSSDLELAADSKMPEDKLEEPPNDLDLEIPQINSQPHNFLSSASSANQPNNNLLPSAPYENTPLV
jgi:hypothetical protein